MAEALLLGFLKSKSFVKDNVVVTDVSYQRR